MNCERAQQSFLAALAGERVDGGDAALAKHVATCTACGDATAEMTALWSNMGAFADVPPPADLRARFDAAVAEWRRPQADTGRDRDRSHAATRVGWIPRFTAFAAWRPAPIAVAVAVAIGVAGFALGHVAAMRGGQMSALRHDLQSMRSMVALSLLQQRSPIDRLQGVGWSTRVTAPDAEVVDVLFETLESDPNVDVRLAVVDALARLSDSGDVGVRLLQSLRRQPSPLVQIAIIDALVHRRDADAQSTLRSVATDSLVNDAVRQRARWGDQQLTM